MDLLWVTDPDDDFSWPKIRDLLPVRRPIFLFPASWFMPNSLDLYWGKAFLPIYVTTVDRNCSPTLTFPQQSGPVQEHWDLTNWPTWMHAKITVLNPLTHPHTYPYALAYLFTLHLALRPIPKGSYENTRLTFCFSWYKYQCLDTPKVVPSDISEVNLACSVTIFNEVRSQNPIKMSNQEHVSQTPETSPSISPSVETLRLHLSRDVPLMEAALIPSFPQDIASPVSQYSFLRDLQGSDLTVSEPNSFQPILPYPESLQRSEASTSSMVREEPNFMTMVRGMRQKLFRRACGR